MSGDFKLTDLNKEKNSLTIFYRTVDTITFDIDWISKVKSRLDMLVLTINKLSSISEALTNLFWEF